MKHIYYFYVFIFLLISQDFLIHKLLIFIFILLYRIPKVCVTHKLIVFVNLFICFI